MSIENGTARVAVPPDVAVNPGYYDAELSIDDEPARNPHAWFVLAPPASCVSVAQRCGRDRAFGVMLNLYSMRSRENWGIGDLSDIARVSRRLAACGGRFVGLSPLHATAHRGSGISPYYPSSRLFFNWNYVDVDGVPEAQTWRLTLAQPKSRPAGPASATISARGACVVHRALKEAVILRPRLTVAQPKSRPAEPAAASR